MYLLTKVIKYKTALTLMVVMLFGLALTPVVASAANTDFGFNTFESELALGTDTNLNATIAKIINVALSLLGIVAVVIILIGGFKYMVAGGNDEKTSEARKLIFSGIIGLAIILSAFAIAKFVLGSLSQATGTGNLTS